MIPSASHTHLFGDIMHRPIFDSNNELGMSLYNINDRTSVLRYDDITLPNINNFCSICQIPFIESNICRIINTCSHFFHMECIDRWLTNHTTCPCCRYDLLSVHESDMHSNINTHAIETEDTELSYLSDSTDSDMPELIECDDDIFDTNNTNNTSGFGISQPVINDIHNFINITTPWINSFINMNTSNIGSGTWTTSTNGINASNINSHVNNFINDINPLLQSFSSGLLNGQRLF